LAKWWEFLHTPTLLLTLNQKWLPCTHHMSWWHANFLYRQSRKYIHTEEEIIIDMKLRDYKKLFAFDPIHTKFSVTVFTVNDTFIWLYTTQLCVNVFLFTSWQMVGCATPGSPSHIPSHPAIGQKVLVLSTATSVIDYITIYY